MVQVKNSSIPTPQNLKDMKPFSRDKQTEKLPKSSDKLAENNQAEISENARLSSSKNHSDLSPTQAEDKSLEVTDALKKAPVLPILNPISADTLSKKIDNLSPENKVKLEKLKSEPLIKKPAVIFIEGFSAFGISNGDGISEMAENFPGAKKFSWEEHEKILSEIKKHAPSQPVILVGHSFGGDTAIEIANELNSAKNAFRSIDLLVSIDAVGMNKTIIPMNVKRNLNFFGEGLIPFIHGDPTVARNTKYTEVTNELRAELHSRMEDNPEVQFQIFEKMNEVLSKKDSEEIEKPTDNSPSLLKS